jgi:cyclic pyranopterin phosphate synthase
VLGEIRLEQKSGGKRGLWRRSGAVPVRPNSAAVIVASTGAAAGSRVDTTGPLIAAWLEERGYGTELTVVSDAAIGEELSRVVATGPAVVITTGGTGMSPTDSTPEATRAIVDRELPGVAEAIRAKGLATTPTAVLSRGLAGTANGTVIVNLPGSTGGVRDGLAVLDGLLAHLVDQVAGGGAHD